MKARSSIRIMIVVVAPSVLMSCATVNNDSGKPQARDTRGSLVAESVRPEIQARKTELLKSIKSVAIQPSSSVSFLESVILFKSGIAISSLPKPSVSDELKKAFESRGITVSGNSADTDAVLLCDVKKTVSWGGAQVHESSTGIQTSENVANVNWEAKLQIKSKLGETLWEKSVKGYLEAGMTQVADLSKAVLVADGRFRPDKEDTGFTVSDADYAKADFKLLVQLESAIGELASSMGR